MHLLLDLIREYLVLERDQRKITNIHRYGDQERLRSAIQLSQIDESDTARTLDYIEKLAAAYDQKLVTLVEGVVEHIEQSKAHVSRWPIVSQVTIVPPGKDHTKSWSGSRLWPESAEGDSVSGSRYFFVNRERVRKGGS